MCAFKEARLAVRRKIQGGTIAEPAARQFRIEITCEMIYRTAIDEITPSARESKKAAALLELYAGGALIAHAS
jgi:hypothetical protein